MDLRQLEYLVAVAEERHFTRAAARCRVSQSTVSASIAALERELGTAMFARDARRVTLTAAGQVLLTYARQALAVVEDGRRVVSGAGALQGFLRVGAIQIFGAVNVPQALSAFHRAHDQVRISLIHDSAPALLRATVDGQVDLCFVDGPVDERRLARRRVGADRLHLIVPTGDPLARRDCISLDDPLLADRAFLDYRLDSALTAQVEVACAAAGLARHVVCEVQTIQFLLECAREGLGLAILPPLAAGYERWDLASIPITPPLARELSVVTPRHAPRPVVAAFLEILDALADSAG